MFWDNPNDDETTQRFKNFTAFKFYGTNKERDEFLNGPAGTFFIIGMILLIVVMVSC